MSLRIGFFSLKQGAGCTAIAAHVANFLASGGDFSVALTEKVANGQEPEYHRIKAVFEPDGTCRLNNVHIYPFEAGLEPSEDAIVYDFGVINFMFRFPDKMDKLYICTDGNADSAAGIVRFKNTFDNNSGSDLKFDVVLFGASKEQFMAFKQNPNLAFASSMTVIPDKKEQRLDYNLAMKIQNVFRTTRCGLKPPAYDNATAYEPMQFYRKDEYKRMAKPAAPAQDAPAQPRQDGNNPAKKGPEPARKKLGAGKPHTESPAPRPKKDGFQNADLFMPGFQQVPEPTEKAAKKDEPAAPESPKEKDLETEKREPDPCPETSAPAYEAPLQEPRRVLLPAEIEGISAPGVLGEVAEAVKASFGACCALFIVTKPPEKLFVFTDMNVFFEKIGVLQREIRPEGDIHYGILTFREGRPPEVIAAEAALPDPYNRVRLLDADIRSGGKIDDEALKVHYELSSFAEVLYAS